MKKITQILLLLIPFSYSAFAINLTNGQLDAIVDNPEIFVDIVSGLELGELKQATVAALKHAEKGDDENKVKSALANITSIAVAKSGEDAFAVALAALNAVGDTHKPTVAAAAYLVSGDYADEVKNGLIAATSGPLKKNIESTLNKPLSETLGKNGVREAAYFSSLIGSISPSAFSGTGFGSDPQAKLGSTTVNKKLSTGQAAAAPTSTPKSRSSSKKRKGIKYEGQVFFSAKDILKGRPINDKLTRAEINAIGASTASVIATATSTIF